MNNITHFAERKIYLWFLYEKCKCQYAVRFFRLSAISIRLIGHLFGMSLFAAMRYHIYEHCTYIRRYANNVFYYVWCHAIIYLNMKVVQYFYLFYGKSIVNVHNQVLLRISKYVHKYATETHMCCVLYKWRPILLNKCVLSYILYVYRCSVFGCKKRYTNVKV